MAGKDPHMVVIIMGVSGSGKTTVGRLLAKDIGWPFYDGDDFHPQANVAKMKQGIPLEDADRWPWLERLATEIDRWLEAGGAVLGCSALKESYRQVLRGGRENVRLVPFGREQGPDPSPSCRAPAPLHADFVVGQPICHPRAARRWAVGGYYSRARANRPTD